MTQDEKKLLLRDLCARLPYGVKGRVSSRDCNNRECDFVATIGGKLYDRFAVAQELWFDNVTIKPYLFPLSCMTEEQKKELKVMCDWCDDEKDAQSILVLYHNHCVMKTDVIDWFIKNHFDYRGLIPLGLANDATGLNIY